MYTAPAHQLTQEFAILLGVLVEPLSQLGQRLATMRNLVFFDLGHLGICLTFVLEAGIPSCGSNQFLFDLTKQKAGLPKLVGPRASTILPYHTNQYILRQRDSGLWNQTLVLPWKMIGSWPGPSEYANVQTAWAPLSSNPARSLWNCWTPSDWRNHLLYGALSLQAERHGWQMILHIWAREFIKCIKAQACVFYKHWATNLNEIKLNKSSVNYFL
jgi:hypothetical protein